MNPERTGVTLDTTLAYCPACRASEQALITARSSGVYLERICPARGTVATRIVADYRWYLERTEAPRAVSRMKGGGKLVKGCPFDCGPCECHNASLHLPIVSVTNLCNLDCPICFTYNRPDRGYCKSPEDFRAILGHLRDRAGKVELINITGGEPTLHPRLFELLALCRENGIDRVTMNTNGLVLSSDREFAARIRDAGVQVVLSLDTLDPGKSARIHGRDVTGEKREALRLLEELRIPTTILSVCIRGVNEEETAELARTYLPKPFVRGITIQNMTFTGENGSRFLPREHVTIDEVEGLLASGGGFSRDDFFPLGAYHPLCYSVAYYIVCGGRTIPLTRIVGKEPLTSATSGSYVLDGEGDFASRFREGIDRLWAEGEEEETIRALRRFLGEVYPPGENLPPAERRRRAESGVRMIYIHPHMDADNFDIARASCCGDLVPDESGAMIPACTYNLLYRRKDPRFWKEGVE